MLTGELIRDIGRVLPWLADVREDPAGNPSRLEGRTRLSRRVAKEAVEALASNLRHRYNAVNAAISGATNKLLDEIGSFEHGTVMDPDGAGAASSEQAEAYFRAQCEELRDLRLALNRLDSLSAPHVDTWVAFFEGRLESLLDGSRQRDALGGKSAFGQEIYLEIQRLHALFAAVVDCFQELRWLMMINSGVVAPTTGRVFTTGTEFVSSIDDA